MDFNQILFYAHSGIRWVVVLLTLLALVWLVRALLQKRSYDALTERIMRFFSIGVAAQWALGIILFVVLGGFDVRQRWEHAFMMTLALVAAHGHYMLKKRPERVRIIGGIISILLVLTFVVLGIIVLPGGTERLF